ncbi:DUF4105 domain-containing protein [Phycisphaerales bacterium AB-hyl4]|uniref:DUF4105 domain-containing protein n=1 Tax=Natronomicrosphaera hydrolytica TaxID=3242702 RepID=A0ABV4U3Y2_9BACT
MPRRLCPGGRDARAGRTRPCDPRANVRGNDVHIYPMAVNPAQARVLLTSMLERAETLAESPAFYRTLHSTCATNLAWHLRTINEPTRRWDWRILLPGYSDRLSLARGWIADADELTLAELGERYRINGRSTLPADDDAINWARQIRQVD